MAGAPAHCLQRRTTCTIQNGCHWALNWLMGYGKGLPINFWAIPSTFEKVDDGGEKRGGQEENRGNSGH